MEAVKQGSCAVGLKVSSWGSGHVPARSASPNATSPTPQSDTHVVLATLKRAESELSSYQRKVHKIDDHMGIAVAGLTADGRVLCKYMRNECLNHRCSNGRGQITDQDQGSGPMGALCAVPCMPWCCVQPMPDTARQQACTT